MVPELIWCEGRMMSPEEHLFTSKSDANLRGLSVFEGIAAYQSSGRYAVVSLEEHVSRLKQSADLMHIPSPADLASHIKEAISDLLGCFDEDRIYLRPTLCLTNGYYSSKAESTLFVSAKPQKSPPLDPMSCAIVHQRHLAPSTYPSKAKVGASYAFYRLARIEASEAGADEAILLSTDGYVAETPGASIFAVVDGKVLTPSLDTGILPSITRATCISILRQQIGLEVLECQLEVDEIKAADEVLLTGTLDEVRLVGELDGDLVGSGLYTVGEQLRSCYLAAVKNSTSPYLTQEWISKDDSEAKR